MTHTCVKWMAFLVSAVLSVALISDSNAETFEIGLEPFPPLITEDITGPSIDLLRAIDAQSEHDFLIIIMPYNRAKKELREDRLDLIGHTPYQKETDEFYRYAQEVDWSVPAVLDIYSMKKKHTLPSVYPRLSMIGTPRGNAEFIAELMKMKTEQFFANGNIDNLVEMMAIGRLPAFIFARAPTINMIQILGIEGVHYRHLETLQASFAVPRTERGHQVKQIIEKGLKKVDMSAIFEQQHQYHVMANEGIVPISMTPSDRLDGG